MRRLGAIAFMAFLVLSALVLGVLGAPALLFGQNAGRAVVKLWARIVLGALKVFTGVRWRIEGAENLPEGGALIASNHQSMWETLVFFLLLKKPVMILKAELLRVPIYGWWAHQAGNIAIDREGGARALRAMQSAAARKIAEGAQVVVFPEGTRAPPGETMPYQPGVAGIYLRAHAPCTPVAHDSGRFWRHPGIGKTPGEITLRILPPIAPGLDRRTFLAELARRINAARPDLEAGKSDG